MKKKGLLIGIGVVLVFALIGMFLPKEKEQEPVYEKPKAQEEKVVKESKEELDTIYEENEVINKYLNQYNKANPDEPINKDDVRPDETGGIKHDDTAVTYKPGFEVNITDDFSGLVVTISAGEPLDTDPEEYKPVFRGFLLGFDDGLSEDQIKEYWDLTVKEGDTSPQKDGYEFYSQGGGYGDDKIDVIKVIHLK